MDRVVRVLIVVAGLAAVAWCGVGLAYRLLLLSLPVAQDGPVAGPALSAAGPGEEDPGVDVAAILDHDIFRSAASPPPSVPERPERREIGLRLLGTVLAADPAASRAIILDQRSKRQGLYKVGDRVAGAVLVRILARKVVLRLDRSLVELEVAAAPAPAPAAAPSPPPAGPAGPPAGAEVISVSRHRVDNAIRAAGRILKSLKLTPYEEDGVQKGFRVGGLKVGSFLHQMGLRNRDVVLEVNGEPLTSMDAAIRLFDKYRDSDEATLTVLRRGREKKIHYRIRR